ncbi:hypothetical protein ACLB1O_22040 [Escherichia coli]
MVPDATVARIEQLFQQPHDGVTGVNTGYDDLNKKPLACSRRILLSSPRVRRWVQNNICDEPRRKRGDVAG